VSALNKAQKFGAIFWEILFRPWALNIGLLLYNKNKIKKYAVSLKNNKNPLKTLTY
jgi:hypothetical protein